MSNSIRILACVCLVSLAASFLAARRHRPAATSRVNAPLSVARRLKIAKAYGKLPLRFEANEGQTDRQVRFISRGNGYSLFLTRTESVFSLNGQPGGGPVSPAPAKEASAADSNRTAVLRMKLIGANHAAAAKGLEKLPGTSNYFIGSDPTMWRTNVPNYAKVEFEDVYPDIDLVYYGNQRQLEYDFIVAPGANPSVIQLGFSGAQIKVDAQGDLLLSTSGREVRWRKPVIYQEMDGNRKPIEGRYVEVSKNTVGFELSAYDARRALVIDPQLIYSTYLGGNSSDTAFAVAVDSAGDAYVVGLTGSSDFPSLNPLQASLNGLTDAFVAKLNAAGDGLVYSTYLGGSAIDSAYNVAVDSTGNAYITGLTSSSDFPTTSGAYQTTAPGTGVQFVTKLNAAGNALIYSTYLDGSESGTFLHSPKITIDFFGNAYIAGSVFASDYPTTTGAPQSTYGGGGDCVVSKLDPAGSSLLYSTYLGGSSQDECTGIAVDSTGNAYVSGTTTSSDFPFTQSVGKTGGFVTKLNNSGTGWVFSTEIGGASGNHGGAGGGAIALDSSNNIYLAGTTTATDFPITLNAYQGTFGGGNTDGFVMELDSAGANILFASYLGGNAGDGCGDIALDPSGKVYVVGVTNSPNFPLKNAMQIGFAGGVEDAFVAQFDPSSTGSGTLVFSTYMGGSGADNTFGIATDSAGNAYVAGNTSSSDFPITTGAFQVAFNGGANDGWVAKFGASGGSGQAANITATSGSAQAVMAGAPVPAPFSATVTDSSGNAVPNQTVTFTAPSSGASGSFAGGGATSTATTNSSGVATSAAFTANTTAGSYTVIATVSGVAGSASFTLTNVDFVLSPSSSGTVQINAGQSANVTLNLATNPAGAALPVDVTYSCSVQATLNGVNCSVNPTSTSAGSTSGSTTLTITTPAGGSAASVLPFSAPQIPLGLYLLLSLTAIPGFMLLAPCRKLVPLRTRSLCLSAVLLIITVTGLVGCSGSSHPQGPGTVSVTSTAGTLSKTTTINFSVN